ncbi:PSP1 C-terminal conserved region containing protein [Novymonas esmeraldas]|uniref:PSP1 C-terminal conserved region containing protein n=1 Tax=Novymonas esmeraldas TaxID=1808958 RepID=A0AAW0EP54_9TRYP
MSSKVVADSGSATGGAAYNTRRHAGAHSSNRRATASRAGAPRKAPVNAAVEDVAGDGSRHVRAPLHDTHASKPRLSARSKPSQGDTVAAATTTTTTATATAAARPRREPASAAAVAPVPIRALSASSPEFIPRQYMQSQHDDSAAANTRAELSVASPASPQSCQMSSAVSPHIFTSRSADAWSSAHRSESTAGVDQPAATAAIAGHTAGSPSLSAVSAHHLRGAYARATAAAGAANRETAAAAAAAAATGGLCLQHVNPYASGGVAASVTAAQRMQAQTEMLLHQQQQHQQQHRPALETTCGALPATRGVYGPSVAVYHPQFIDVASGSMSMTPFALLQDRLDASVGEDGGAADHRGEEAMSPPAEADARSDGTAAGEAHRFSHASSAAAPPSLSQRRVSAVTAALLAIQDAKLAEQVLRGTAGAPSQQRSRELYVAAAAVTATPAPLGPQRRAPGGAPASVAAPAEAADAEVSVHETPKRRTSAAPTGAIAGAVHDGRLGSGAATTERMFACLASTGERADGGWSGSAMGLTGSTRRALPTRCDDDDDYDGGEAGTVEGRRSGSVTPTTTPAKVLAVEGSPFVMAAADTSDVSAARAYRRSVSPEGDAVTPVDSCAAESVNTTSTASLLHHAQGNSSSNSSLHSGSNANLQRAMMHLIAQIHTSNGRAQHAQATSAAAAAAAVTPQKPSGHAAVSPGTFKTPEVERVPSARPSASKSTASRIITTIIHSPSTSGANHRGEPAATTTVASEPALQAKGSRAAAAAAAAAEPKGAQRSLASCLEAIAPQRAEGARQGQTTSATRAKATPTPAPVAPPPPSSSSGSSASAAASAAAAMPVPRSQRRGARQTTASHAETTQPPAAQQANRYAVVIEGHMQRRVTAVSTTTLKRGVCVLFEEDRGIDMGRVVQCDVLDSDEAAGAVATLASATSPLSRRDRPAPVLRLATADEEYRWLYADVKEAEATVEPCREAAARLGLPVTVVAAVYQFNRAKLTFYYESPTRVDFRPLLPSLFSRFHCRIWMARMETPESMPPVSPTPN